MPWQQHEDAINEEELFEFDAWILTNDVVLEKVDNCTVLSYVRFQHSTSSHCSLSCHTACLAGWILLTIAVLSQPSHICRGGTLVTLFCSSTRLVLLTTIPL